MIFYDISFAIAATKRPNEIDSGNKSQIVFSELIRFFVTPNRQSIHQKRVETDYEKLSANV